MGLLRLRAVVSSLAGMPARSVEADYLTSRLEWRDWRRDASFPLAARFAGLRFDAASSSPLPLLRRADMAQMTTSLRMSHPEAGSNLLRGRAAAATRRAAPRAPCAQAAADFSPDRLAFAMRRQVADAHEAEASRKARSAPTGSAASAASAVPPRKASRREARARAAAEAAAAEAAARRHSEAAQAKLRERTAALDAATLASALRLQLTQSGTFDEVGPQGPRGGGLQGGPQRGREDREGRMLDEAFGLHCMPCAAPSTPRSHTSPLSASLPPLPPPDGAFRGQRQQPRWRSHPLRRPHQRAHQRRRRHARGRRPRRLLPGRNAALHSRPLGSGGRHSDCLKQFWQPVLCAAGVPVSAWPCLPGRRACLAACQAARLLDRAP